MAGAKELHAKLQAFHYQGEPLPKSLTLSEDRPVVDYFKQFRGLDAGPRFNGAGFWELPIPVTKDIDTYPDDVVIYDAQGYGPLKEFLHKHGIRHVLLTGYAGDETALALSGAISGTFSLLRKPVSEVQLVDKRYPRRRQQLLKDWRATQGIPEK